MITFQLDECLNDRAFAQECTQGGLAIAWRFPNALRGVPDDEVISVLLKSDRPFVTKDRGFVRDHIASMPRNHPGVIIIHQGDTNPHTMTVRLVKRILGGFKERFSDWHKTELRNTIVELTQDNIRLSHITDQRVVVDVELPLQEERLADLIAQVLTRNAAASKAAHLANNAGSRHDGIE
jgi:hypothetical protein